MDAPDTTLGGKLLSCELDVACSTLDCDAVMGDYADALLASQEGEEFVAHYCGRQYLQRQVIDKKDDG
ncbi:MAG: hypothetical protein Q8M09_00215 [Pseudomonadota bacterium]|nr:hypothetical protein [Pseudomonadota bacterium]MDP1902669.1 hypothetical protein [Pseudomonadota bacterium]MDP2353347.1 hypothetical protein [Pseudomonadota bacterium]